MHIKNSYLSGEGNHVVFAEGEYINISQNDKFVVALVEHSSINQVMDILRVALGKIEHGIGISLWCRT